MFFKKEPRTFVAKIGTSFLFGTSTITEFGSVASSEGWFDYKKTMPGMFIHPAWTRFSGLFDAVIVEFFAHQSEESPSCILHM